MTSTPISLLNRLKTAKPDASEWRRLSDIYLPLIHVWLARVPALGDEAADLGQEILLVVAREVPRFERLREGSFRAWLRQVTINRVRAYTRGRQRRPEAIDAADVFLTQLQDPVSALSQQWDREHDQHVLGQLTAAIEPDFTPSTWAAFRRTALDGASVAAVAQELGISENAVLLAKSRVLRRLRSEAAGLLE